MGKDVPSTSEVARQKHSEAVQFKISCYSLAQLKFVINNEDLYWAELVHLMVFEPWLSPINLNNFKGVIVKIIHLRN